MCIRDSSYTATFYPEHLRAAGLGWSLGIGRIGAIAGPLYGGVVMATGAGFAANFLAFAIPAVLGAIVMVLVPRGAATHP